jgi:hypothetical protein
MGARPHPDRTQSRAAAFRVAPYFHDPDRDSYPADLSRFKNELRTRAPANEW